MLETPSVVYQAPQWLAVNKPASWSVHNEPGNDLVSYLRQQDGRQFAAASPVHRLDIGTSGLVIFALTPEAAQAFGGMLVAGQIKKQYVGISSGLPRRATVGQWQEWTMPLSRKAEGRKNPAGLSKDRVAARTRYLVEQVGKSHALLRMEAVTGRKHQLRRHSAIAGCALLGDERYGDKKLADRLRAQYGFDRLALHAQSLSFKDPWTSAALTLEVAIPEVFATLL